MAPSNRPTYRRPSGPNCRLVGKADDWPASRLLPKPIGTAPRAGNAQATAAVTIVTARTPARTRARADRTNAMRSPSRGARTATDGRPRATVADEHDEGQRA